MRGGRRRGSHGMHARAAAGRSEAPSLCPRAPDQAAPLLHLLAHEAQVGGDARRAHLLLVEQPARGVAGARMCAQVRRVRTGKLGIATGRKQASASTSPPPPLHPAQQPHLAWRHVGARATSHASSAGSPPPYPAANTLLLAAAAPAAAASAPATARCSGCATPTGVACGTCCARSAATIDAVRLIVRLTTVGVVAAGPMAPAARLRGSSTTWIQPSAPPVNSTGVPLPAAA